MKQVGKWFCFFTLVVFIFLQMSCAEMLSILFFPEPESCKEARAIKERIIILEHRFKHDPPIETIERTDLECRLENLKVQYGKKSKECDDDEKGIKISSKLKSPEWVASSSL